MKDNETQSTPLHYFMNSGAPLSAVACCVLGAPREPRGNLHPLGSEDDGTRARETIEHQGRVSDGELVGKRGNHVLPCPVARGAMTIRAWGYEARAARMALARARTARARTQIGGPMRE